MKEDDVGRYEQEIERNFNKLFLSLKLHAANKLGRCWPGDSRETAVTSEDFAMDAFVRGRNWDPNKGPLKPYLKKILENLIKDSFKSRRLMAPITPDTEKSLFAADVFKETEAKEIREWMLRDFPTNSLEREITKGIIDENAKPREIAEKFGLPVNEVYNLKKRLRRWVSYNVSFLTAR